MSELEDYLKSLNPKSSDLIYNAEYHIWRDRQYLGVATWKKDDNIGDSFQKVGQKDGKHVNEVFIPNQWKLKLDE